MDTMREWLATERTTAEAWCHGRTGIPRALMLLWLVAILVYLWQDPPQRGIFDWPNLFSGINLGIHELGHVVFALLGEFMAILGGSLLQCLAPVAAIWSIHRQGDYFGAAICAGWLSTNLFGVATYVVDAQAQALPLVSPFSGHPLHDWNFLLTRMDLLDSCEGLGLALKLLGTVVMLLALGGGSWLVWKMVRPATGA